MSPVAHVLRPGRAQMLGISKVCLERSCSGVRYSGWGLEALFPSGRVTAVGTGFAAALPRKSWEVSSRHHLNVSCDEKPWSRGLGWVGRGAVGAVTSGPDASTVGRVDLDQASPLIHSTRLVAHACERASGAPCVELQERVTSRKNVTPCAVLAL